MVILLVVLNDSVSAQNDVSSLDPDSLLIEIEKAVKPAEKVKMLILLSNVLATKTPAKAREYAEMALEINSRLKSDIFLARIYLVIGYSYINETELDKAEQYLDSALAIVANTDFHNELSMIYLNLGNIAQQRSKNQLAIHYLERSRVLKERINDRNGLSKVFITMGNIYYFQGEYDQSADWYMKALRILRETGDELTEAKTLTNIGNIYMVTGNYPKALEYYRQCLGIREKHNDRKGISTIFNNLGSVYYYTQDYDSAIYYYQKSIDIKREFNDLYSIAGTLSNIGSIYRVLKNYKEASKYYNESLEIREQLGNSFELASAYYNMGEFLIDQGKREDALRYYGYSMKIAEEHNFQRVLVSVYKRLSLLYEEQRDYKQALEYKKKYVQARESEFKESYRKSLEEIEKYKLEEQKQINDLLTKETEIQALQIEHDRARRLTLFLIYSGSVLLVLLFAMMIYILYRRKSRTNKKLLKINAEISRIQEEAIKTSEEFERILSSISDLIYSVTYCEENGLSDIYFSPALTKMTGVTLNEIQENPELWKDLIYPPDMQVLKVKIKGAPDESFEDDQEHSMEFRVIHRDGSLHWLQQKIKINSIGDGAFRIDGVVRDISERKKVENALRSSEYLYRSTIDSLSDHHIHVIDESYSIRVFNRAFRRLNERMGLSENVIGENIFDVYHFLGIRVREEYANVFSTGKTIITQDSMIISGKEMFTETYKVPVLSNERVTKVITIMKDITEDVKNREELERSEARYRQASISKDKFFSVVAHDLMSPFSALLGFSGLLYDMYDEYTDEERKVHAGRILELSELIYKMAENLLFWSRSQTGRIHVQPEWIDLKSLIRQQIDLSAPHAARKQIKISQKFARDIKTWSDPNLLGIIMRNLITNAIKFTAQGGKVDLSAKVKDERLEIMVKDCGIGIPVEMITKLWTPGSQVKRPGTDMEIGTGLGLMICKEFVGILEGTLSVESEMGKGSCFKITLPNTNGQRVSILSGPEAELTD